MKQSRKEQLPSSYSISDLAAEFAISTRAIRFYEEKGLISPHREGQKRIYSPADRTKLKLILRGKRLGLSLDESREIIDLYDPVHGNRQQLSSLLAKIQEKRQTLLAQLQDINKLLAALEDVEGKCRQALDEAVS